MRILIGMVLIMNCLCSLSTANATSTRNLQGKILAQSKSGNKSKTSIFDDMEVNIIPDPKKASQVKAPLPLQSLKATKSNSIESQNNQQREDQQSQKTYITNNDEMPPSSQVLVQENSQVQISSDSETQKLMKKNPKYKEQVDAEKTPLQLKEENRLEYIETVAMTVFAGGFIFLFKSFMTYCPCFTFLKDDPMKEAVYSLLREVMAISLGAAILSGFNFYNLLDTEDDNIVSMVYCLLLGVAIWIVLGFILIRFAQVQIMKWEQYEQITSDYEQLEKLKKQYETIYYRDQPLGQINFDAEFQQKITYFLMRLEFIHPIFLPPLSEQFLRKDFNFAQYLAYAYGKTLANFFNISWFTLILLAAGVGLARLGWSHSFTRSDPYGEPILETLVPFVFLVKFLLTYLHFKKIDRMLHPHVRKTNGEYLKPEEINFHDNYDVVDPFTLYDNIPQPEYLDLEGSDDESVRGFEEDQNEDEESSMVQNSASRRSDESQMRRHILQVWDKQDKKAASKFFGLYQKESEFGSLANRHEQLFMCGRSGKTITKILLQVFYLMSIIYMAAYVVYSAEKAFKDYDDDHGTGTVIPVAFIIVICPLSMVIIWLSLLPPTLTKYTIITNIEMMKDRDIIDKILNVQKMDRQRRSYRIYQVMKVIRREMALELQQHIKDKRLRGFTKKQLIEQFERLDGQKSKAVQGQAIKSLIRLCGSNLTNQEQSILLRKSKSKGDQVRYKDFSQAVELIINDVKIDAFYVVHSLFQLFFRGKEKVQFSEFKTFFGEFVSYFQQDDIDGFLNEVQFIKRDNDEIYVQEVASMIRDDVELFPK